MRWLGGPQASHHRRHPRRALSGLATAACRRAVNCSSGQRLASAGAAGSGGKPRVACSGSRVARKDWNTRRVYFARGPGENTFPIDHRPRERRQRVRSGVDQDALPQASGIGLPRWRGHSGTLVRHTVDERWTIASIDGVSQSSRQRPSRVAPPPTETPFCSTSQDDRRY